MEWGGGGNGGEREEIRLDISCESSVKQKIPMKS